MYRQNGDLVKLLKSARKKSAPECPFECGGGSNRYLGNAQIEVTLFLKGASLNMISVLFFIGPSGDFGAMACQYCDVHIKQGTFEIFYSDLFADCLGWRRAIWVFRS